jgi:hypothetical protein
MKRTPPKNIRERTQTQRAASKQQQETPCLVSIFHSSKAQEEKEKETTKRKDLAEKRPFGVTGEQIAVAVSEEKPSAKMYP